MSKIYGDLYKEKLEKISDFCNKKVAQIDDFSESGIATQTDYAMAYAYRKVLKIIEESED